MSTEGDVVVEVPSTASAGVVSIETALREVLRRSLYHDGLSRGLRETVKSLDRRTAHLCVLAESCEEKEYVRLIEALCKQHQIPLVKVADAKQLGEWVGLCKIDKKGDAQKVVACACVVVRDFGEESEFLEILMDSVKRQ